MKVFIESQSGYCPLTCMVHSRGVSNKINHLHERSLRSAYKNNISSFEYLFNPHMHKLGPWGPTHYIFGDQFYSKNARKLRFHVFLHFYARKHMISSFYPKWTEFTRNCEFHSKYGSRGNQTKLEQNSQFLVNSVHFR